MPSPPALLYLGRISWFTNLALILSFHLPDCSTGTRELIFQVKLFWKSGLTPCESQLESSSKIHLIFQPSSSFSRLLQKAPKYAYFSFPLLSTCTVKGSYIMHFRQDRGDGPVRLHTAALDTPRHLHEHLLCESPTPSNFNSPSSCDSHINELCQTKF